MNILLIEDELLIQKSLKKLMEKKGATVTALSSGKIAIEHIVAQDYDKIICDLMLQDITGFDVIEDAKKKYTPQEISQRFIIITAYTSPQVLEKAESYNCKIVSKPFEDLKKALDLFLAEV